MIEIIKSTIDYYMKNFKIPEINDIKIDDTDLLNERGSFFVTVYYKGEVRGGAGNIREIKDNSCLELIENTITAISKDPRFKPINISEVPELKIRADKIVSRNILKDKNINDIDPTNSGIIVIKKDYKKIACILPNINAKLFNGEDFIPVLNAKLGEKEFNIKDYIVYEIKTEIETNY